MRVGQSLVSLLIDGTFRDHHRWVETNVYCDDHEMRKQADLSHRCFDRNEVGVT